MKVFYTMLAALFALSVHAQDLSQVIESVSPAVFKITTYDAANKELSLGTGFFIASDGTALTNYHVLEGAAKAKIKTTGGKTYLMDNVLAWSNEIDLVKFTVKNELRETFPFIKLNASTPKPGERIFTVGCPLGLDQTVSDGIVSSVRQDELYGETVQVTAPISQGSSGSPLMNARGDAVGVMTYFLQSGQNLNFAVSVKNLNALEPVNALRFPADEEVPLDNERGDVSQSLYYGNSHVKFCTQLDADQQPRNESDAFYIGTESWLYVYVQNEKPLATSELIVDVFRKSNGAYDEFIETKNYTVQPGWNDTHFKYTFHQAGDYKIAVYAADDTWINTGFVNVQVGR